METNRLGHGPTWRYIHRCIQSTTAGEAIETSVNTRPLVCKVKPKCGSIEMRELVRIRIDWWLVSAFSSSTLQFPHSCGSPHSHCSEIIPCMPCFVYLHVAHMLACWLSLQLSWGGVNVSPTYSGHTQAHRISILVNISTCLPSDHCPLSHHPVV